MKSVHDLDEYEIRTILSIVYPGWQDDRYEVMKEKVENGSRVIIFRSKMTTGLRRKYDVILHENYDLDLFETYINTGSKGKIEIRNVIAYVQFLQSLQ